MKDITPINSHDLSSMCRLCLSIGVTVDIFSFSTKMKNQLANVIMKCAPVQIKVRDQMPNFICQLCHSQLEGFHQFQLQIVQSEKKLRRYLKQLSTTDSQIKPEYSIEEPSDDNLSRKTTADITVKSESLEQNNIFDMTGNWKERASTNYNAVDKIKEEPSSKSETEDEIDDDSLLVRKSRVETSFKDDGSKINCENTTMVVDHIFKSEIKDEYSVNLEEPSADTVETLFKNKNTEIGCEDKKMGVDNTLKSEIEDEPIDDFSTVLSKSADLVEALPKDYDHEISYEDTKISSADILGNLTRCSADGRTEYSDTGEEKNKKTLINQETCKTENQMKVHQCNGDYTQLQDLKRHKNTRCDHKYQCDVCHKCFRYSTNFKKHKCKNTGTKPYQCDICNEWFARSNYLVIHKLRHTGEKPYQCNICNKSFVQAADLKAHKRTHTGEKPYQCDICKKCFSQSGTLRLHERIHRGDKPHRCNLCNKSFIQATDLKVHQRTHTGEKPYRCDICKKCFKQSGALTTHERVHTGEKPFQCDVCNKTFAQNSLLKVHKRTHTGEKPYRCDICNKCFAQSSTLNIHKRIHR